MKATTVVVLAAYLLIAAACSSENGKRESSANDPSTSQASSAAGQVSSTATNPAAPSESETDRAITQGITEAIVGNSSLSLSAKNISIATHNGQVTLRGAIDNEGERATIGGIVHGISGVANVDDQLVVQKAPTGS